MIRRGALGLLIGTLAGVTVAAGLLSVGIVDLEGTRGAITQYGVAVTLAFLLALPGRLRPGAVPRSATLLLALLTTFALRRWLSASANLVPLEMGHGPAGRLVASAVPLAGALLGAAIAIDAGEGDTACR